MTKNSVNDEFPAVGIIGPGAVGCALASRLHPIVSQLGMIGRQGPISHEFKVQGKSGMQSYRLPVLSRFNLLFVCVKSYHLASLFQTHRHFLESPSCSAIIFLCNGIVDDVVKSQLPSSAPVRLGLTTLAVKPKGSVACYQLMNEDSAAIHWGGKGPVSYFETKLLMLGKHLGFAWREDIDFARRRKWLFNTVLNPVCALHRLPRNDMAKNHVAQIELLFAEAYTLGQSLWGTWPQSLVELLKTFWQLVDQTGQNRNSMVVDLDHGRATEIDYLSGLYIQDHAHSYPHLQAVTEAVHRFKAC